MKKNTKLGSTGKFPDGKLTETDRGELQFVIMEYNGKVIIDFGTPVHWLGFSAEQALEIANILEKQAINIMAKKCNNSQKN